MDLSVLAGFAAGTYYDTRGGGSNYQCMPLDPEYGEHAPGGFNAILSGVEYRMSHNDLLNRFIYQNVPCARCYTTNSAVMMIPGKRSCPSTWKREYEGKSN